MQKMFAVIPVSLCILLAMGTPSRAGNIIVAEGKSAWVSTQCVKPVPPAAAKDPETPANAMNAHVNAYNDYVKIEQAYMACLTTEAHRDAEAAGRAIVAAAQSQIDSERQHVSSLGGTLQQQAAK